jgi:hypothetical protein
VEVSDDLLSGGAIAALLGGAVALLRGWWEQRRGLRVEDRTDLGLVVAELRRDNDRLRDERGELARRAESLNLRLTELAAQSDELPLPMLYLSLGPGVILWINGAVEATWLPPLKLVAHDVVGRPFAEVLDLEIATEIGAILAAAAAHPARAALVESVHLPGIPDRWHVYVCPDMRRRGEHQVGWIILAIPRGHSTGGTG